MDLSIIIVNWNSKDYLKKCIASIIKNTDGLEYEIVVIDGGSFDGCGEMLRQTYPQVGFIQSAKNIGFAKANNEAYLVSTGRNILFLNPDTYVEKDALFRLWKHLEAIPNAGIVGAKLLNSDGSIQTSCIRSFPTILNQLLDAEFLQRRFPNSCLWGTAPLFDGTTRPVEVEAISGACLMIKRAVFEKVWEFSDDYFMYSEDIDLCYKVRNAGWAVIYVPSVAIVHHGGGSTKREVSKFSSVMMIESRYRFFQKTRSSRYCFFYRLTLFFSVAIRTVMMLLLWPILSVYGKSYAIKAPMKKWIDIGRWTIGLEKWVKSY